MNDQYLTLTIVMVITGRLYVTVNVGLWQTGGGAQVPDLKVSVVSSIRDGLRRRALLHHIALLHLLLFTCFLSEEKTN